MSIPARCRAANFQNPLPSRRRPLPIANGVPSEIRTPDLPLRRRTLYSNELRERIVGPRPGNRTRAVYGDLPLRAYEAQPHISAPIPKFATCAASLDANFGIKRGTNNIRFSCGLRI